MVRISANIWEWWTTTGRQLQVRLGQRSLNWHVPCAAASRLAACLARDTQSFKFITSTKNTVTPGRQLRVRVVASTTTPSRQLQVSHHMTDTCRGRAGAPAPAFSAHMPRQGFKFKTWAILKLQLRNVWQLVQTRNYWDQLASKLELELPNLTQWSKIKLNLLQVCRLDGSCVPAAASPRLRLPVSSRSYGLGKVSDGKGQLPQASRCTAATLQCGTDSGCLCWLGVVARLKLPESSSPTDKLIEVRVMRLSVAFTGLVLVKANKSTHGIF